MTHRKSGPTSPTGTQKLLRAHRRALLAGVLLYGLSAIVAGYSLLHHLPGPEKSGDDTWVCEKGGTGGEDPLDYGIGEAGGRGGSVTGGAAGDTGSGSGGIGGDNSSASSPPPRASSSPTGKPAKSPASSLLPTSAPSASAAAVAPSSSVAPAPSGTPNPEGSP